MELLGDTLGVEPMLPVLVLEVVLRDLSDFIYDGWVGNWARVGYVNHGSYVKCQNSIVCNQFTIHSVLIVTRINSSIHKLISAH